MTTERKKKTVTTTPKPTVTKAYSHLLQPFVNLPPIFAPTLVRSKNSSTSPSDQSSSSNDSPPPQPDHCADNSVLMGFEDDFVPTNTHHNKDLSSNTT